MNTPVRPDSEQLLREARIGLIICALLLAIFGYVLWNKYSGAWDELPAHVANAPVAHDIAEDHRRKPLSKTDAIDRAISLSADLTKSIEEIKSDRSEQIKQIDNRNRFKTTPLPETFTSQSQSFAKKPKSSNTKATPSPVETGQSNHPFSVNELRSSNAQKIKQVNHEEPTRHADQSFKGIPKPTRSNDSKPSAIDDPFKSIQKTADHQPASNQIKIENVDLTPKRFQARPETKPIPESTNLRGMIRQKSSFQVRVESETEIADAVEKPIAPFGKENPKPVALANQNSGSFEPTGQLPEKEFRPEANPLEVTYVPIRNEDSQPKSTTNLPQTFNESGNKSLYTTNGIENLWSIAQTVYDDGRLFRALYQQNIDILVDINKIPAGTQLSVPPLEQLITKHSEWIPPDLLPTTTNANNIYVTRSEDTLFDIARNQLGQASRFHELYNLNRAVLPSDFEPSDSLPPGLQIELPK